jgi:tetratricopeptide (TPR) repeat protein
MANRHPRVFLSSPLGELQPFRENARRMIAGMGFAVFAFEHDMPARSGSPISQIEHEIKNSDIIIALFGLSCGTSLGIEPLSFTEKEIRTAFLLGKEVKIYILEPHRYILEPHRDDVVAPSKARQVRHMELALLHLRDPYIGLSHARAKSSDELLIKIYKDLREWNRFGSNEGDKGSELFVGQIIRDYRQRTKGDPRNALSRLLLPGSELGNLMDQAVQRMREAHAKHRYGEVWKAGVTILDAFQGVSFGLPMGAHTRQVLVVLASILSLVESAASFLGQLQRSRGALSLSKALLQTYYCLGDWVRYAGTASEISSIYYMLDRMNEAKQWNDFALARLPAEASASKSGTLSIRASVVRYGKRGAPRQEVDGYLIEALRLTQRQADQQGLLLSQLGSWELATGRAKDARRHLEQALGMLRHTPPLWVRAAREWARYLQWSGDAHEEFLRIEAEVRQICERHSLLHQQRRWAELFKDYRPSGWP